MEIIIDVLYNILPVVIEDLVNENTDSDSNSSDSSDSSTTQKRLSVQFIYNFIVFILSY